MGKERGKNTDSLSPALIANKFWIDFRKKYLEDNLSEKIDPDLREHYYFYLRLFEKLPADFPMSTLEAIYIRYKYSKGLNAELEQERVV